MSDEKKNSNRHAVIMEQRERVTVTGVIDVISFDEETIISETEMGVLILRGGNLHVNRLNLESGELEVDGEIIGLNYEESTGFTKGKSSLLSRIFK